MFQQTVLQQCDIILNVVTIQQLREKLPLFLRDTKGNICGKVHGICNLVSKGSEMFLTQPVCQSDFFCLGGKIPDRTTYAKDSLWLTVSVHLEGKVWQSSSHPGRRKENACIPGLLLVLLLLHLGPQSMTGAAFGAGSSPSVNPLWKCHQSHTQR